MSGTAARRVCERQRDRIGLLSDSAGSAKRVRFDGDGAGEQRRDQQLEEEVAVRLHDQCTRGRRADAHERELAEVCR